MCDIVKVSTTVADSMEWRLKVNLLEMETGWWRSDESPNKLRNTLKITGRGVLLFGAWAILKPLIALYLNRAETIAAVRSLLDEGTVISDRDILWLCTVMLAVMLSTELIARIIVGMMAISEGRGHRHSVVYLIFGGLLLIASLFGALQKLYQAVVFIRETAPENMAGGILETWFTSFIMEAASVLMLIELLSAAIRLRMQQKKELAASAGE